ncbi:DNA polymerase III subunit gamma/tau [Campylobacter mucosalis]|uniref:DNA polymerase III subunit gamma/tau n=1 Tax=Campylobacter mucosalis TaxID=202 RepID=UPI0014700E63|nr:DNA polymerase III subunit gamma/tau [Campylobacter mucosalis]
MQALALKYRPKNFDELIGQESVSKSLAHALDESRLGHAYLFSGLRGSGKTSSARIFSKALVCENGPTSRPCEICAHCQMANEGRHIDIIEMDAASHRKIDDIRELIEQTKYAPASARFKIFIIDEVHMLTKEAFNALLKTLEEPPSYVKFILATTDPLKLPTTVLSRTQHFRFKQISRLNILKHLQFILSKEGISYENEALEILARSGSGSLRDTLTLLDQAIIFSTAHITQSSVASMLGLLDPSRIEQILQTIISSDRQALKTLILELESYEPDMIIDEIIANLKEKFINNDPNFSLLVYERFFRILAQAKTMLNTTSDNGFVLSIMLFMMMEALNLQSIDEAISQAKSQAKPEIQTIQIAQKEPEQTKTTRSDDKYQQFIAKIYDRDFDLGECFKRSVEFIGFDNQTLRLCTPASGNDREILVSRFKIINQICKEIFGEQTKIDAQKKEMRTTNELDSLKDELKNLQSSKEPQAQTQIPQRAENTTTLLDLNASKSKEELEALKQNSILNEARTLFGEPRIQND